MSNKQNSNPFTTAEQVTLCQVLEMIEADNDLYQQRRRNLCSSIRSLGKLMERDLRYLPAHPRYYRNLLKRLHTEQCGLTEKRISNIKSDVLFALRHTGCIHPGHTYMAPFTSEWQKLWDMADCAGSLRRYLSRLMHYCSANGIPPKGVNDEASERFRVALVEESFINNPIKTHQNICKLWNKAANEVHGWPAIKLTVPRYKERYTIPLEDFPASLLAEVDAWTARLSGADILDNFGPLRPLKPRTIESRLYRLTQIVSALVHRGWAIEDITSLSKIVQIDAAKLALKYYLDRNGGETSTQIHGLAVLIKTIAVHWVGVDKVNVNELRGLCKRLLPKIAGLTKKNRERLRQFDDPKNANLLLNFPSSTAQRIRKQDRGRRKDAVDVQIALAVELLLMMPIRAGNLASLSLDRHICRSRAGAKGVVHVVIPADEVKNSEHLEFELPRETVSLLDVYLKDYHPRLVDGPSEWLFPGRGTKPKTRAHLGDQISKHVHKATGLRVNIHLFRHIAAKLYLDQNPGGYEVCRRILGHRSMDTTIRFYAGMETAAASRHFDAEILKLRKSLCDRIAIS